MNFYYIFGKIFSYIQLNQIVRDVSLKIKATRIFMTFQYNRGA